jgi:predicted phosphodiesterase
MRIAAVYDIHGNLPALEAVLGEVEACGVDEVVVGGDVVPGPMPAATLRRLRDCAVPISYLAGNGEADVLAAARGHPLDRVPEAFRDVVRWTADTLSRDDLAAFARWPATLHRVVPGVGTVLFCHATPRDDNELFTAVTPEERLRSVFDGVADVVICGHTHMQFDRVVGATRVANAGSVGLPFGEPGAYWALLTPDVVELRRTGYDLEEAVARFASTAYPRLETMDLLSPPEASAMVAAFEAAAMGSR